eukprot:330117-Chlamydomonas_euryale.AAC.1
MASLPTAAAENSFAKGPENRQQCGDPHIHTFSHLAGALGSGSQHIVRCGAESGLVHRTVHRHR